MQEVNTLSVSRGYYPESFQVGPCLSVVETKKCSFNNLGG